MAHITRSLLDSIYGEEIRAKMVKLEWVDPKQFATLIAKGELLLWIARDEHRVIGTVQLSLCQKPNGRNRAEIQKLMVHSSARRLGVAHQLITTLEKSALQAHRGLLYLDTQAGSAAEAFYRTEGYRCMGEIPDYACTPDGQYHPTAIYYKRLFAVVQPAKAS